MLFTIGFCTDSGDGASIIMAAFIRFCCNSYVLFSKNSISIFTTTKDWKSSSSRENSYREVRVWLLTCKKYKDERINSLFDLHVMYVKKICIYGYMCTYASELN